MGVRLKKGDMFNLNCINSDKLIRINKLCALMMENRKKIIILKREF
jgi:hypothetical protein